MKTFYHIKGLDNPKEIWGKVKDTHLGFALEVKTVFTKSAEDNRFKVVFSTDSEDRHLERVYQNFNLKNFKSNPIFLDSHNYSSIEHIIGRVEGIKVKDGVLQGEVVFALENPKGLLAYHLANGGFLGATSIGFIPLDFDDNGDITKSELLEISAVSVPANPEALFEKMVKEFVAEQEDETNEAVEEVEQPTGQPVEPTEQKRAKLYSGVKKLRIEQKELLIKVAECFTLPNKEEQKRKIFKTIREGLK